MSPTESSPIVSRIVKSALMAAVIILTVVAALVLAGAPTASANQPTVNVPLSAEPAPLSANPFQAVTVWTVYPASCAAVASAAGPVCAERAEVWACPTALSHGAVLRAEPAYNEVIAQPLAYRSTHCEFESTVVVAAAAWPPLAGRVIAATDPTPAPTNPCPANGVLTDHPTLGVICVFTSDADPTEGPPPAEIAFTGTETTVAAMLGLGLVSTGTAVLGVRRRMVDDDDDRELS